MKFSSGFTAFVVGSVAISNIASAAPVSTRDISQSNSQGTTQNANGNNVSQKSDSNQQNTQGVKISKDDGLNVVYHGTQPSHPSSGSPPSSGHPSSGSPPSDDGHKSSGGKTGDVISIDALNGNKVNTQVAGTGNQKNKRGGSTGDVVSLPILNGNDANLQILGTGNQKNSGGHKSHYSHDDDDQKTGDVISAPILNDNNANAQVAGTGNQSNGKRGLPFLSAIGQQSGSADGSGGSSSQSQTNKPVVSGSGNSVGTGGNQSATNDGTGGEVLQDLTQKLNARQLQGLFEGAQGKQGASANGYGGSSQQGQHNAPVLSGAGNSLTAGGAQQSQNNGQGGEITQDLLQKLQGRQFLGASGKQGASADGFGGSSQQGQHNAPVLSGAGNSLTAGGAQQSQNDGQGGDITQKLLQNLQGRQLFSQGKQGASANGQGGESAQGQTNTPVLSGAGNSLTAGGSQGAENNGQGGSIEQSLSQLQSLGGGLGKRQGLFAQGKQGASADGFGGSSQQGQTNNPVLSGAGNSLTAGGAQSSENNGSGGDIQQTLGQKLGLGKRQGLFASGSQKGSADGFGGSSFQGQTNKPVVSGAGNSVTTGGSQFGENDGTGGSVSQSLAQQLGLGKRQFESAFGAQGASADGYGGSSFQNQDNRPVVSGTGNSVTAGGSQGSENNGQGGSIKQGLQQLFGRQFQGLGQGIGQGIDQTGGANAKGGSTAIVGNNGPAYVNGDATAGTVNQGASGQQYGAQSATQGLSQQKENQFGGAYWRRQYQGLDQGINQGIKQNGQANAEGGSAYISGGNGPAYVSNGAQGGAVNQNGKAAQDGQQSGTQSLSQQFSNIFGRDLQAQGQLAQQGTKQSASADATGGPVYVSGGWTTGPTKIDSSAHAGTISQDSDSNQQDKQGASQSDAHHRRQVQTQVQGNSQDTSSNADASAKAGPYVASGYFWHHAPDSWHAPSGSAAVGGDIKQNTQASQANKQGASQNARRSAPSSYNSQLSNANSKGGSSYSDETNDKVVQGNGLSSVQGGGQSSDGSSTGGTISQLLQI